MEQQQQNRSKKRKASSSNIPIQLANLIKGEAAAIDEGGAVMEEGSLNEVVSACQSRHVKELSSYIRSVCMRIGLCDGID